MAVRVHYGTQSFTLPQSEPATVARQAYEILTKQPEQGGILNLQTASGQVYLLITRSIPFAVEDFDDGMEFDAAQMGF